MEQQHVHPELPPDAPMRIQEHLIRTSGIDPARWVDQYAGDVRRILDENPQLGQLYAQNPQAVEEFIRAQLGEKGKAI